MGTNVIPLFVVGSPVILNPNFLYMGTAYIDELTVISHSSGFF